MTSPPELDIPSSDVAVSVRIIDTTSEIHGLPVTPWFLPKVHGFSKMTCPSFSFLIEHPSGRTILFDLGIRKDYENLTPRIVNNIQKSGWTIVVQKGVREQLEEHGVQTKGIEAIILSHHHFDHLGDPSTFDSSTALVVGPGFKKTYIPAYPDNENAPIQNSDFQGRELREINFSTGDHLKIGKFPAYDYFKDGSFYLLESPGHAIGHMCGLARVKTSPDSYILMGGDAAHHVAELRPSDYLRIPSQINPHPFNPQLHRPCPGELFDKLLRDGDPSKSLLIANDPEDGGGINADNETALETTIKIQEADAHANIFVVLAHDHSLVDVCDFFPKYANDFVEKGWVQKGMWAFLKDFQKAAEN